ADEEALRRSPGRFVVSEDAGEDDRRGGGDPRGGSWNGSVSAFRRVSALRRRTALRRGCPACLAGSGSERGPEQTEIVATGLRIEIGRAAGIGGIGDQGLEHRPPGRGIGRSIA